MQAYFLTRGNIYDVEKLIDFLKTRTMMMPFTAPDGKKMFQPQSLIVRPVQLWEIAFPESEKDKVFNSLHFDNPPYPDNLKMKAMLYGLRKALNSKPIPEFCKDKFLFMPFKAMENIQIIPIGFREDKMDFKEENGTTHEAI